LFVQWNDKRLSWDLALFGDVDIISIPVDLIWLSDLYVINSAEKNGFLSYKNHMAFLVSDCFILINIGLNGK
jgi:hypothetical protein